MANPKLNLPQRRPCTLCSVQHKNSTQRKNCRNRYEREKMREKKSIQEFSQHKYDQLSNVTTLTLQQCLQDFQQDELGQNPFDSQYSCLSSTFFILKLIMSFFSLFNKRLCIIDDLVQQYQTVARKHRTTLSFCLNMKTSQLMIKNHAEFRSQFVQKLSLRLQNVIEIFSKRKHRMDTFIKYCQNIDEIIFKRGWIAQLQKFCQQITENSRHFQKQQWLLFETKITQINKKFILNKHTVKDEELQFIRNVERYAKYLNQQGRLRSQLDYVISKVKKIHNLQQGLFKTWQIVRQKTTIPLKILFENKKIVDKARLFKSKNICRRTRNASNNDTIEWESLRDKLAHLSTLFVTYQLANAHQYIPNVVRYFGGKTLQIKTLQKQYTQSILKNVEQLNIIMLRYNEDFTDTQFQPTYKQYQFFFYTINLLRDNFPQIRQTAKFFKRIKTLLLNIEKGFPVMKIQADKIQQFIDFRVQIERIVQIAGKTLYLIQKMFDQVRIKHKYALDSNKQMIQLHKKVEYMNNKSAKNGHKSRFTIVADSICINDDNNQIQPFDDLVKKDNKVGIESQSMENQYFSDSQSSSSESQYRCRLKKSEAPVQQRQLQFYPQTKVCKYLKLLLRTNKYTWMILPQNIIEAVLYGTYGSKSKNIVIDDKLSNQKLIELIQTQKQRVCTKKQTKIKKKNKIDKQQAEKDQIFIKNLKICEDLGIKRQFMCLYSDNFDKIRLDKFVQIFQQAKIEKILQNLVTEPLTNNKISQSNPKISAYDFLCQLRQNRKIQSIQQVQQCWFRDFSCALNSLQSQNQEIWQVTLRHHQERQQYWKHCKQFPWVTRIHIMQKIHKTAINQIKQLKLKKSQKLEKYLTQVNQQNQDYDQIVNQHKRKLQKDRKRPQSITYYEEMKQRFEAYYRKSKTTFRHLKQLQSKKKNQRIIANDRLQDCKPIACGPDNIDQFIIHGNRYQQAKRQWLMHLRKIQQQLVCKDTSLVQLFKDCRPFGRQQQKYYLKFDNFNSDLLQDDVPLIKFKDQLKIVGRSNVQQNNLSQESQFLDIPFDYRLKIQKRIRQLKFQNYRQFVNYIERRQQCFLKLQQKDLDFMKKQIYKEQYKYHFENTSQYLSRYQFIQESQIQETYQRISIKSFISLAKCIPIFNNKRKGMPYYIALLLDEDFRRIDEFLGPVQITISEQRQNIYKELLKKQKIAQIQRLDSEFFNTDFDQWALKQTYFLGKRQENEHSEKNQQQIIEEEVNQPIINNLLNFDDQQSKTQKSIDKHQIQQQNIIFSQIQKMIPQSVEVEVIPVETQQKVILNKQIEFGIQQVNEIESNQQDSEKNIQPLTIDEQKYVDEIPKKVLMKYQLKPKKQQFRRPPFSTNQEKIFFNNQIKMFFHNKNIDKYRFQIRRNVADQLKVKFDPKIDKRSFKRLGKQHLQLLNDYQTGKIVFPLKYVFVNKKIGGGFQASRDIEQDQVVAFFNGKILTIEEGQLRKNCHNMMDYIMMKINGQITWTVVTTCDQVWGIGPMFNHASQQKANLKIIGYLTPYGTQYIVSVKRKIIKGQHLTWNYCSGDSKTYKMKDLQGKVTRQQDIQQIVRKNWQNIQNIKDLTLRYWKIAENYPFEKINQLQLRHFLRLKNQKLGCSQIYAILKVIDKNKINKRTCYVRQITKIKQFFFENDTILLPIFYCKNHWIFVKITVGQTIILQINDSILKDLSIYKIQLQNILNKITNTISSFSQKAFEIKVNQKFPQQTNQVDCGVFMISGMREILDNVKFDGSRIPKVRKQLASLLVQ